VADADFGLGESVAHVAIGLIGHGAHRTRHRVACEGLYFIGMTSGARFVLCQQGPREMKS
jgi:hypothetical protein